MIIMFAIYFEALNLTFNNDDERLALDGVFYASTVYVGLIAILLFIHSLVFVSIDNVATSEGIENAYYALNMIPFINGALEIPLVFPYGGPLPILCWLIFGGIAGVSGHLCMAAADQLTPTSIKMLIVAWLLLYQVTADFSEYWAQARQRRDPRKGEHVSDVEQPESPEEKEPIVGNDKHTLESEYRKTLRIEDDVILILREGANKARDAWKDSDDEDLKTQLKEDWDELEKIYQDFIRKQYF